MEGTYGSPGRSQEVARACRQRQVEIDGCQNRTRLIGLLACIKNRTAKENAVRFFNVSLSKMAMNTPQGSAVIPDPQTERQSYFYHSTATNMMFLALHSNNLYKHSSPISNHIH